MNTLPIPTEHYSIIQTLQQLVTLAFEEYGYSVGTGISVVRSVPPQTSQFQCNEAFAIAKKHKVSPLTVAENVAGYLRNNPLFTSVTAVAPGFINMNVSDEYLAAQTTQLLNNREELSAGIEKETIVLDYGGANVAKPLHVGHLRTAIIGQSLKLIARALGHTVVSDVHLGDWGLQMGMVIHELSLRHPELPYFDADFTGPYPKESPVSMEDLDELYPQASLHAKDDEATMQAARIATVELQHGRPGYRALWHYFVDVSVAGLRRDYAALGVDFDLWLGESDANDRATRLTEVLLERSLARKSDGATVFDISSSSDKKELPPLLLYNSDGAVLYGGTDLATIQERVEHYHPDRIIYVVDKRQSLHLVQVFHAAQLAGLTSTSVTLEHVEFGTMNGSDNKPFKTRAGGTMKLNELSEILRKEAKKRIDEIREAGKYSNEERDTIVRLVGVAALKFADLSNYREKDYVFDPKRFSSFEGATGPYLLYSTVRAQSILKKAEYKSSHPGAILKPETDAERDLHLMLDAYQSAVLSAWEKRSPTELCNYVYALATAFSTFYHECPVLSEEDHERRTSLLHLVHLVQDTMVRSLGLLGIEVPDRM